MFDIPITCSIDDGRYADPRNCNQYTTAREIWKKSNRAAARKATADGVNQIAIKATGNRFYIYQISGYTMEKGLFCYNLNESGQIIKSY
jgi:hypothetical protein